MKKSPSQFSKCLMALCVLVMTFYSVHSNAQGTVPPVKHWQNAIQSVHQQIPSKDWPLSIIQTSDGGYVSAGWTNPVDPIDPTNPLNYRGTFPAIVKLDANGKFQWEYDFNIQGTFQDIIEVSDGYVAVGYSYATSEATILEIQKDGAGVIFQKDIRSSSKSYSVRYAPDNAGGKYIVSGYAFNNSTTGNDMWIAKLDATGNEIWENFFDANFSPAQAEVAFCVRPIYANGTNPDGNGIGSIIGFILAGRTDVPGFLPNLPKDVFIVTTDPSGNEVSRLIFDSGNSAQMSSLGYSKIYTEYETCTPTTPNNRDGAEWVEQLQGVNSGFIIGALFNYVSSNDSQLELCSPDHADDHKDGDAVLIKLDISGLTVSGNWARNVAHFSGDDFFIRVKQTNDLGFAVFGTTSDDFAGPYPLTTPANILEDPSDDNNFFLIKTDALGSVKWRKAFLGQDRTVDYGNCGFGLAYCNDGGYAVCGNNGKEYTPNPIANDDDFVFVKLYSECQPNALASFNTPTGDLLNGITINTVVAPWNTSRKINGTVRIQAGGVLTISGATTTIEFTDARQMIDFDVLASNNFPVITPTKIIVEPGGKLIINGATLKGLNSCGTSNMWQGIEVWGNPLATQLPTSNQGLVTLSNSAVIQDAIMGILDNKSDYNSLGRMTFDNFAMGGGIIIAATGTTFRNCRFSSHFAGYHKSFDSNNPSVSRFSFCNFKNDLPMADPDFTGLDINGNPFRSGNNTFVSILDNRGIRFIASQFQSTINGVPLENRGQGIVSWDASYTVLNNNIFSNLTNGIQANSIAGIGDVFVSNNTFNENAFGITMNGSGYGTITLNNFNVPLAPPINNFSAYFGIYSTSGNGFKIEQNQFTSDPANNTFSLNDAIDVYNSGYLQNGATIYRNSFLNFNVGNRMGQDNTMLLNDCNTYSSNKSGYVHWAITSGQLQNPQGSCFPNNDPTAPEANQFMGSCTGSQQISVNHPNGALDFHYNSYVSLLPTCFNLPHVDVFGCTAQGQFVNSTACPSSISSPCPNCTTTVISNYSSQLRTLQNQLAAGDAQGLLNIIATGNPGQIKNALLAAGPYLSDRVLIAAINKGLPPAILKDIIIPNSPVTQPVRDALSHISLPNGIRNQINNAQTDAESPRQQLVEQIAFVNSELQQAISEIVRLDLDSGMTDSAISILSRFGGHEVICALVNLKMAKDTAGIASTLNSLQQAANSQLQTDPGCINCPGTISFCNFYQSILQMRDRPGSYFSITPTELQNITSIANGTTPIAINAQSLLNLLYGQNFARLPELLGNNNLRITSNENGSNTSNEKPNIKIYPNPSDGNFTLDYEIEGDQNGRVEIYDFTGRNVESVVVPAGKNSKNLSLAQLPNGVYFYKLIVSDAVIFTDKFVIIK